MKNNQQNTLSRRRFVQMSTMGLAAMPVSKMIASPPVKYEAVMFDAFVLFNPKPVSLMAEQIFPGKGNEFVSTMRAKQFEYCFLRTAGNKYRNFWDITRSALTYAAKKNNLAPGEFDVDQIMEAHLKLDLWPDVTESLQRLKKQNINLSLLSNLDPEMLKANIKHNNLDGYFDHVLSTGEIKTYKPNPMAYNLGVKTTGVKKEEIVFAAFAPWDVTGARWFGYPTYWVNRANIQPEELDAAADATGNNLGGMIEFINKK